MSEGSCCVVWVDLTVNDKSIPYEVGVNLLVVEKKGLSIFKKS